MSTWVNVDVDVEIGFRIARIEISDATLSASYPTLPNLSNATRAMKSLEPKLVEDWFDAILPYTDLPEDTRVVMINYAHNKCGWVLQVESMQFDPVQTGYEMRTIDVTITEPV